MERRSFFRIAAGAAVALATGLPKLATALPISAIGAASPGLTMAKLQEIHDHLMAQGDGMHKFSPADYTGEWEWRNVEALKSGFIEHRYSCRVIERDSWHFVSE